MHCTEIAKYGFENPEKLLISLLVDEEFPSRSNRGRLLDPRYNRIGVSSGPHKVYKKMVVIDLAQLPEKKLDK